MYTNLVCLYIYIYVWGYIYVCLTYKYGKQHIALFSLWMKGWVPGSLEVEGFLCISCFSCCSWWIIECGSSWGVGRGRAGVGTRPAAPGTHVGRWHEQTGLSSCHLCTLVFFHHPGGGRLCLQYQWLNGTPFVTFAVGLKVWVSKAGLIW